MSVHVRAPGRHLALALGFALPIAHVTVAFAQDAPGGGAAPAGGGAQQGAPGGQGQGQTTTTTTFFPGGVAPTPPGGTLGGGNAEFSSSKPILGNERDTFDFQRGTRTGTVRGDPNASFIIGEDRGPAPVRTPDVHTVRKGDTLWAICDFYFRNPYQWPRVWSYNPQIQNPHWIYPGDQVALRGDGSDADRAGLGDGQASDRGGLVDRRRQVPPDTVFLRNSGFIDDESNNWGEITGAREDKLILSDFDEVYIKIGKGHDVKVGQELTVYRPVRRVGKGKLIEIQGTVTVNQWNAKDRIARARITESLDAIERGARIGPIERRFEVVAPTRNERDVDGAVLASVQPVNLYGQHQVVFVNKGEDAGLKPGNRLFVIRKGDAWHATHPGVAMRIALEDESPAATENVPKPREENKLPEEVLAELRVISVRKNTALTVVTASRREIESGDRVVARKGY
jgi:hypothetical protein